jgi:hypothetical protein
MAGKSGKYMVKPGQKQISASERIGRDSITGTVVMSCSGNNPVSRITFGLLFGIVGRGLL